MKTISTGLLLAALGTLAATPAHAIIIRHDVADSDYVVADADYPALVDLVGRGDCIGTLVHESYLLSVAHCAVDLENGQSLDVGGVSQVIADVILHPSWRATSDEFDIALVRFETPVRSVAPLPIYRATDELGAVITLVGRGVTATGLQGERGGDTDGILRRATNIVSAVNDHFIEIIFEREGEAGVTQLEGVGAAGDSGCPAFIEVGGTAYIAGLNSYGDGGGGIGIGEYGARDYQTRVSQYLDWLDSVVDFTPPEPRDAGASPQDAGTEPSDASIEPGDAGTEPQDAGTEPRDGSAGSREASTGSRDDGEGCSSSTAGPFSRQGLGFGFLLALAALLRRRVRGRLVREQSRSDAR